MAVICRLVRSQKHHGITKVLSPYVFPRNKSDMVDSTIPATSSLPPSVARKDTTKPLASKTTKYIPYLDMLNMRRQEARRSILVEIEGIKDSGGLRHFCELAGPVNKCFLYRSSGKNFVLVEFKSEIAKSTAMKNAYHSKDPQSIPVTSPFLYFHNSSEKMSGSAILDCTQDVQCSEKKMIEELQNLDSSDNDRLMTDINHLHNKSEISDLSTRLRFFTCHQLDVALGGLFSRVRALPFGSSVSGFGRNTGDLDIFLQFKRNINVEKSTKSQLFYHSKAWVRDKNLQLKLIGDLISVMLPGCSGVLSILSARVPIIKYRQAITNLECDLQNTCPSGVDLSHILWIMKHWDKRVAPLMYTLRIWAGYNNVCSMKKPSPLLTNFSLMIMVIFFLQSQKILPTLHSFRNLPDKIITPSLDPNSALVFPDLRKLTSDMLPVVDNCNLSVDTLLFSFFDYYSKFDFQKNQISVYHGKNMPKISHAPLEVENPANANLNISQNVSRDGLQAFVRAVNSARKTLGEDGYKSLSVSVLLTNKGSHAGVPLSEARPHSLSEKKLKKYT